MKHAKNIIIGVLIILVFILIFLLSITKDSYLEKEITNSTDYINDDLLIGAIQEVSNYEDCINNNIDVLSCIFHKVALERLVLESEHFANIHVDKLPKLSKDTLYVPIEWLTVDSSGNYDDSIVLTSFSYTDGKYLIDGIIERNLEFAYGPALIARGDSVILRVRDISENSEEIVTGFKILIGNDSDSNYSEVSIDDIKEIMQKVIEHESL